MRFVAGGATDTGLLRDGNEDSYVIDPRLQLYAVADGMGGHRGGEVASATALEALRAAVASGLPLADAIGNANTAVWDKAAEDAALAGMGTTLTAAAPFTQGVLVGHVGDSRAYLFHAGALSQLTTDHSLVEELVREGRLTAEQAEVHPQRSIITRALGVESGVEVDVYNVNAQPGDRILICSDGLTTMVRAEEIAEVLRRFADPTSAANALVDVANAAGGEDNITVVILDCEDDGNPLIAAPVDLAEGAAVAAPIGNLPGTEVGGAAEIDEQSPLPAAPSPPPPEPHPTGLGPDEDYESRARRSPARRTGRFLAVALPVVLVVAIAVVLTAWFARRTYFVSYDAQDRVTVFKGRPGGLLVWDPTVETRSDLVRADLAEDERLRVDREPEFANRGEAEAFVIRLESSNTTRAADGSTSSSSTTTTTLPTSSTLRPATPPSLSLHLLTRQPARL